MIAARFLFFLFWSSVFLSALFLPLYDTLIVAGTISFLLTSVSSIKEN